VHSHVAVTLLESVELLDVVQVVASDDDGSLHLGGDAHALQDRSTNADIPGEWALLVHEMTFLGFLWHGVAQADAAPVPCRLLGLLGQKSFGAQEHGILLLKRLLVLIHGACGLFEGDDVSWPF